VLQWPGVPLLTIGHVGKQVIVSCSPSATRRTLQTNANHGPPMWGNCLGSVINNIVTNSPIAGNLSVFVTLQ